MTKLRESIAMEIEQLKFNLIGSEQLNFSRLK
jgi:hypothetical protein